MPGDRRIVADDRETFLVLRMNGKYLSLIDRLSNFLIIIECLQCMRHTKDRPKFYSLSFITSSIIGIYFSSGPRQMFLIFVNLGRVRLVWDVWWFARELIRVRVEILIVVSLLSPIWRSCRFLFPSCLSSIIWLLIAEDLAGELHNLKQGWPWLASRRNADERL